MMVLATLASQLAGFAGLALSMSKHHRDLFGAPPSRLRKLVLATGGWILLGVSLALVILKERPPVGIVLWFGAATFASLAVAMGLTYGPRAPSSRSTPKSHGRRA